MTAVQVDANNILFRIAFRLVKSRNFLETESDKIGFISEFFSEIEECVNNINSSKKKLIFARDDSHSWRKNLFPEEISYKGKRNRDYKFNIKNFNLWFDELMILLKDLGYHTVQSSELEGDDLIMISSEVFFNSGISSVIISGDSDLTQLSRANDKNFVVCYNPDPGKKKFFSPMHLKESEEDTFAFESVENGINQNCEIINPKLVLMKKIMCGDDGDNIPSCFYYGVKEKLTSFTELRFDQMLGMFKDRLENTEIHQYEELYKIIFAFLQTIKNFNPASFDFDTFQKGMNRNRKMIELRMENLPELVLEHGFKTVISELKTKRDHPQFSTKLLVGTPYYGAGKNEKYFA